VAALTPICVAKFQQSRDAIANLATLKAISSTWEQGSFIEKGGWATKLGAASPDYQLARACIGPDQDCRTVIPVGDPDWQGIQIASRLVSPGIRRNKVFNNRFA